MHKDIECILYSEEQIAAKVSELADAINKDYEGREILFITVLKGGFVFSSDLLRKLTGKVQVNFIKASSYGSGTVSTGHIKLSSFDTAAALGKDILIAEDILDSGNTLFYLKRFLTNCGAASVKICVLLDKPSRRTADIVPDYFGYQVPDKFVVGYGLDYSEYYRNLPYIGVLKPVVYEK